MAILTQAQVKALLKTKFEARFGYNDQEDGSDAQEAIGDFCDGLADDIADVLRDLINSADISFSLTAPGGGGTVTGSITLVDQDES